LARLSWRQRLASRLTSDDVGSRRERFDQRRLLCVARVLARLREGELLPVIDVVATPTTLEKIKANPSVATTSFRFIEMPFRRPDD
jgi:hypothetical protein